MKTCKKRSVANNGDQCSTDYCGNNVITDNLLVFNRSYTVCDCSCIMHVRGCIKKKLGNYYAWPCVIM